jgi:2-iminobutanoate/2-iminopropanoate deaminase
MSKLTPRPDGLAVPKAPYSPVVVDGGLVYTAGQVGFDENGELVPGGIEAQTRRALENLTACLLAAGCERTDVLKVNAYLADLAEFEGFNAVYREFFEEPFPARTTVGVTLPGGLLVEIEATARVPT